MSDKIRFAKEYKTAKELVSLLQRRGLRVEDPAGAERCLSTISDYRLSAYLYPLLKAPKSGNTYKEGSSFNQAMCLYRFDKELRLLIFDEIEKIEIAVRTAIIDECAAAYGNAFWMTDKNNFINAKRYERALLAIDNELNKSHEEFIVHFRDKYSDPYPPAWMLAEIIPLGVLTNIFVNIDSPKAKKNVAQRFGLQLPVFNSWLTTVTLMRNSCCHHSRVWNRHNTINPKYPKRVSAPWVKLRPDTNRVYFNICIIKYFVDRISSDNNMMEKLLRLFSAYPDVDKLAMGFPGGWMEEPLWRWSAGCQ